jgi:hypothetical protein
MVSIFFISLLWIAGGNCPVIRGNPISPSTSFDRAILKRVLMEIIWKEIAGYCGYEITEDGQVRNKESKCVLKTQLQNGGYLIVALRKNKKRKAATIHRLVATTFIPNPNNKPQVNHIDGNKENNHINNLEWCTLKENMRHASMMGLCHNGVWTDERRRQQGELSRKIHAGKPKTKEHNLKNSIAHKGNIYGKHTPIIAFSSTDTLLFESVRSAAAALNIDRSKINRVLDTGTELIGYYFYKNQPRHEKAR